MNCDLGFLGGGQLARMSIQAAQRMGLRCLSLDPGVDTPASQIAPSFQGALDDPSAIASILDQCDHVTLENEFIPAAALHEAFKISGRDDSILMPGIETLATIQDKLLQRQAYATAGVPSPRADALETLMASRSHLGQALVLKARFGGYDGKGTRYARTDEEFDERTADLGDGSGWLAEGFVPFRREVAVMVYVSPTQRGCFPTMETVQTNHVCDLVFPVDDPATDVRAQAVALAAVEAVCGRGLFGVELFELDNGDILVNEIAPRPHNTGHYTLDWGGVSQFEQHVRLAMGFEPVVPTGQVTAMANLLGVSGEPNVSAAIRAATSHAGVHAHWYGKREMRPGRKMGHLNAVGIPDVVGTVKLAREDFLSALVD